MTFVYVFYDIPDDHVRLKVAKLLKDYGLLRLQKSVFCGEMSYARAEEIALRIDRVMGSAEGDIRIVFVPESFKNKVIIVRELYNIKEESVIVR